MEETTYKVQYLHLGKEVGTYMCLDCSGCEFIGQGRECSIPKVGVELGSS